MQYEGPNGSQQGSGSLSSAPQAASRIASMRYRVFMPLPFCGLLNVGIKQTDGRRLFYPFFLALPHFIVISPGTYR